MDAGAVLLSLPLTPAVSTTHIAGEVGQGADRCGVVSRTSSENTCLCRYVDHTPSRASTGGHHTQTLDLPQHGSGSRGARSGGAHGACAGKTPSAAPSSGRHRP